MMKINKKNVTCLLLTALTTGCATTKTAVVQAANESPRSKYGPQATRLYHSQDYVRKNAAPDFWALMPYYMPQQDGRSCSVASVAMVINAARVGQKLTASDELVTQKGLLEKVNSDVWSRGVGEGGRGVSLDQLGSLVEKGLKAYGFNHAKVEVVHADDASAEMKKKLSAALSKNEVSANDFMLINFLQSEYTGDPEGAVGHISPVAAYDAKSKRVLIFDSDRQYYEPYWVSEDVLLKGMATRDGTANKARGYVYVSLGK